MHTFWGLTNRFLWQAGHVVAGAPLSSRCVFAHSGPRFTVKPRDGLSMHWVGQYKYGQHESRKESRTQTRKPKGAHELTYTYDDTSPCCLLACVVCSTVMSTASQHKKEQVVHVQEHSLSSFPCQDEHTCVCFLFRGLYAMRRKELLVYVQ